jgi:hypothetical protein
MKGYYMLELRKYRLINEVEGEAKRIKIYKVV